MIGHTQAFWTIILMTAVNLILAVVNTIEIEKLKGEVFPKGQWTYCADGENKPEEYGEYLVTWTGYLGDKITRPMLFIVEYDDEWNTAEIEKLGYSSVIVHAWMSLPETYGYKE